MNLKLKPFDTADYLDCTEARIEYLRGALEEGDKEFVAIALMNIAQSLGLGATIYVKPVGYKESLK